MGVSGLTAWINFSFSDENIRRFFACLPRSGLCSRGTADQISGIYPHLAFYNSEAECGTGAVVPWADRLWVITYGPHLPFGSSDKLYEISPSLTRKTFEGSIGGTPANRMVHRESNQLFIGPYAISGQGSVRTIPYTLMQGRHTGNARHLTDPTHKLYYATMEEGFYEVDVHSLGVNQLYKDGNDRVRNDSSALLNGKLLPGAHGKGAYSGQGVLVYSNNGESGTEAQKRFDVESGSLSEWDGKDWKLIRRNQFVEVTGPGGIYGNANPTTDPIWATGWDHKSVLLGVRDAQKGWSFYRLPKASHSYDGAHGWNTEWPRIRDVGTEGAPDYLMTMHGLFWRFPQTFTAKNTAGIRPRSAYLKVIGDFTRWQNGLVFGCDDSAQKEFLNKRKMKGNIEGPGQSNSNLWFTSIQTPDELGSNTAQGAVWLRENIRANEPSEPFLFSGWAKRVAWLHNAGSDDLTFTFEVDKQGTGRWQQLRAVKVKAGETALVSFLARETGEWIRVKTDKNTLATVNFNYTDAGRDVAEADPMFAGLSPISSTAYSGGLLYALGDNRRKLGVLAGRFEAATYHETGYYELDSTLTLTKKNEANTERFIRERFAIAKDLVSVEEASVLVIDDQNRRWRFPKSTTHFDEKLQGGAVRICREVATERDLMNLHGTFYELPAENADGYAKVRPVASHQLAIHDYASYRGMLVMTGLDLQGSANEHIVTSEDGQARVWLGTIDDLWKLGKPTGVGGPWHTCPVEANVPSDPYLIGFYDKKRLELRHTSTEAVTFRIEVDAIGHGPWMTYKTITLKPNEVFNHAFPPDFQARWIRFVSERACTATALLYYE